MGTALCECCGAMLLQRRNCTAVRTCFDLTTSLAHFSFRRLLLSTPSSPGSFGFASEARRALRNSSRRSTGRRRRATSTVYSGMFEKSCCKRFFPFSFSRTWLRSAGSQKEQRCCPGFGCAGLPFFENMQASPVFTCPWQRRGIVGSSSGVGGL